MRESGFYWVRYDLSLIVAEYDANSSKWKVPGHTFLFTDSEFDEIIETKLIPPTE